MFSLYQEEENVIMRSLYELSKAYQFSCLWDFDVMSKYVNYFSDQVMTTSLGQLQGIFELQLLRQELEDQRSVFLNLISSSAGPSSHTFNGYWEFTEAEYPDIIEQLHNEGQFSFVIDVDPNDVTTTGCQDCYNGRLVGAVYRTRWRHPGKHCSEHRLYKSVPHGRLLFPRARSRRRRGDNLASADARKCRRRSRDVFRPIKPCRFDTGPNAGR
uniref:Uncharacterized protein n=1 Tax=Ciona savignyi TaxID=51511 RepID=H2YQR7_CIOSA